jgi:hypothetical protein
MITIRSTLVFTIGHTKVTLIVEGCVDCGALTSIGAEEAVQHKFRIGDRATRFHLKRCANCAEARGAKWPAEERAKQQQLRGHTPLPAHTVRAATV